MILIKSLLNLNIPLDMKLGISKYKKFGDEIYLQERQV